MRTPLLFAAALGASFACAQFSVPRVIHQHTSPRQGAIETGDIDGDGDQDVLGISGYYGDVDWWENDGAGHFPYKHHLDTIGIWSNDARLADLDADGDLDVIVTGHTTVGLAWAEQLGEGHFMPLVQLVDGGAMFTFDGCVDLNGNGRTDVLVRHTFMGTVTIRWYEFDGSGVFVEHGPVETGLQTPSRVRATDLDQDGTLDLLVSIVGTPSLHKLIGDGNGGFGLGVAVWSLGVHPSHMVLLDHDGDGDDDVAGMFPFSQPGFGMAENLNGDFLDPLAFDTLPGSNTTGLFTADLDDDGDPDILGAADGLLFWSRNDAGSFTPVIRISDHPVSPTRPRTADLDGDGHTDIVVGSSEGLLCWYRNLGNGQFDQFRLIGRGFSIPYDLSLAELDGQPGEDLLVTSGQDSRIGIFPRVPGQLYPSHYLVDSAATAANKTVALDDDGDGDNDLLSILAKDSALVRYENDGQGGFSPVELISYPLNWVNLLEAGDLNGDGYADLIAGGQTMDALVILEGGGNGAYSPPYVLPGSQDATNLRIVDLEEDGDLDIVVAQGPPSHMLIKYINDGSGAFGNADIISQETDYPIYMALGDLDVDGHLDVVAIDEGSHLAVFFGQMNSAFSGPVPISSQDEQPHKTALADFDLDGDLDLIASFDQAGIWWFENDGTGAYPEEHLLLDNQQLQYLSGPLDVDADGDEDIMIWSWDYGTLGYLENMVIGGFTIQGTVFADLNANGLRDPEEPGMPQAHITSDPPATMPLTDPNGDYIFYLPEGSYSIGVSNLPDLWLQTSSPQSYNLSVADQSPAYAGINFGYSPSVDTTIIGLSMDPSQVPCGDTTLHTITATNLGTTRPDLILSYAFDTLYQFLSATPAPDSLVGSTAFWHVDDLGWFESAPIQCRLISPTQEEVAMAPLALNTFVASILDDLGQVVDTFSTAMPMELGCAYDPNDKHVDPVGYGLPGAIPIGTEHLTYRIRFQNTGTAPAHDVVLRDRLSAHLDPSTMEVLGWSHAPSAMGVENDGELYVRFDDIFLPDSAADALGSMGFFTFRIAIRPGVEHATEITNEAEIYFDLEPGIVTNTTLNTLTDCDLWQPVITETFAGVLQASPGDAYQWYQDGLLLPGETAQQLAVPGNGSYEVQVRSLLGCVAMSAAFQFISTMVPVKGADGISVFPVPFSTQARVVLDVHLRSSDVVDLVDPYGRVVRSWSGNGQRQMLIDRQGVAAGAYLVRVSGVDRTVICGVVIE